MSNSYFVSPAVGFKVDRIFCEFCLFIAGMSLLIWMCSFLPQEKVTQTTFGTDGSVVIDSEIFHRLTGLTEKCSARFKAIAVSADTIRLAEVSKSCD
jgi:hypothetical protein